MTTTKLTEMAQDLALHLIESEVNLLERLTIYNIWAGRYRLPKHKEHYMAERSERAYKSSDPDEVERLIQQWKLMAGFDKASGWLARNIEMEPASGKTMEQSKKRRKS